MKVQILNMSIAAFLLIVFQSCTKDAVCDKDSSFRGEWVWLKSYGGIGGWTLTPESEKITRSLFIDDFYYKEFKNDTIIFEDQYDVKLSDVPQIGTTEKTYFDFDNNGHLAFVVKNDTLFLYDQCYDCFDHTFLRK
jgi:hypothetical protein